MAQTDTHSVPRIFVIGSDPTALDRTFCQLREGEYQPRGTTACHEEVLRLLHEDVPDLLLIDGNLPGTSAQAVVDAVRADIELADLPVMVALEHRIDPDDGTAVTIAGADDYLIGPLPGPELLPRIAALFRLNRMEQALRASEARLQTIIGQHPDGILVVDQERLIRFANPAAEQLFQRHADELTDTLFDHPLQPGQISEINIPLCNRHSRTLELRVTDITWENCPAWMAMLRDVTERKRDEFELKLTRFAIDHAVDAAFWLRPDGSVHYVNEAASRLSGYSRDELMSMSIFDVTDQLTPETWQQHWEHLRQVGSLSLSSVLNRKDGHVISVETHANLLTYAGHEYNCASVRDMTEHRQHQEEIQNLLRQQAAIAELSQQALQGSELDLADFRTKAVRLVASICGAEFGCLLERRPEGKALKLAASAGLAEHLVGIATFEGGHGSQAGYTLLSGKPVIMENVRTETRFQLAPLLRDNDVVSGITVLVPGEHASWGVLGVYATQPRVFTRDDLSFIQSVANLMAQVTQRTQTDGAIELSARLLNMAGRMARVGGWVADLEKNRTYWSDEVCDIHEVPVGTELTLSEGIHFYAPEWHARITEVFDACAKHGIPYDEEMEIITSSGRRIWVRTIGEAVRDSRGIVTQVQGAFQDITGRKQREKQVQRLADRLTNTLESITDAVFTVDRNWRFSYVNREAEHILNVDRNQILGENLWDRYREAIGTKFEHYYRTAMHEHCTVEFEEYFEPLGMWLEVHVYPSDEGLTVYFRDVSERRQTADHIEFLASYDPLTRLPNRRLLLDRLQQAMASASRTLEKGAVLFLDLDNFKTLNDTLGHDQGDQLLEQVASRLSATIREDDTVGRFGGDEFMIILERLSDRPEQAAMLAEAVGEKILAFLKQPFLLGELEHHSTTSIGITLFGDHRSHDSAEDVMKRADLAMYEAKADGRNTLRLFDPEMQATINARAKLEKEMRRGLLRQEFMPFYQPQVDADGRLTGAEALMRWRHPTRGLVSPVDFIPLAEDTGLIIPLGRMMLEAVCRQLKIWEKRPETAHLNLAVNVSARQFHHSSFVEQVLEVLDQTGANPERLKLELTESLLLQNMEETISKMQLLKNRGVGFSLDDFGTGYSSLYYLKRLPLEQIKIDKRFVVEGLHNQNDAAIVHTMVILAKNLGLGVIAEGVETEEVREFLREQGCFAYQGFLFSPPLSLRKLEQYRRRH